MKPTVVLGNDSPDQHDYDVVNALHTTIHESSAVSEEAWPAEWDADPDVHAERHGDRVDVTWVLRSS
jgi:hypothetical protein